MKIFRCRSTFCRRAPRFFLGLPLLLWAVGTPADAREAPPEQAAPELLMQQQSPSGAPMVTIPNTEVRTLISDATGDQYDLYIFLPNGYFQPKNAGKTYPVLYHLDGFFTFGVVSDTVRNLQGGLTSDFLVVATSYGAGWGKPGNERMRDYTPGPHKLTDTGGGAEKFARFLRDQLFPFIEQKYRVTPQQRTFHGASLGGLFGAYVLLKHPAMFQNYILSSPAFWVNEEEITELLEAFAARDDVAEKDVYLSMGTEEMGLVEGFSKFINTLDSKEYEGMVNLHVFWGTDEVHATNTMSRLPHILRHIYPPIPDPEQKQEQK